MKVAIIVPCHIPPTKEWIKKLEFRRASVPVETDVIIVDDSNGKLGILPSTWRLYDYPRQEDFLGELYPFFAANFHKSSSCRVFGHILAYSESYDIIIGLDSDCEVRPKFVQDHIDSLSQKGWGWSNPLEEIKVFSKMYSRGFPYSQRNWPVIANMGLWENCLDLYGKDRWENAEPKKVNFPPGDYRIAAAPIPFSGMNFALRREGVPGFLFLPNFDYEYTANPNSINIIKDKFRRHDDIWGGYIFQKIAKRMHNAITYGHPIVDHVSEVIATEDAAEEAGMYKWEDLFLTQVDKFMAEVPSKIKPNYIDLFKSFTQQFCQQARVLPDHFVLYSLVESLEWWVKVWEKYG